MRSYGHAFRGPLESSLNPLGGRGGEEEEKEEGNAKRRLWVMNYGLEAQLGTNLEPGFAVLGSSSAELGGVLSHVGILWGRLGALLGRRGAILEALYAT